LAEPLVLVERDGAVGVVLMNRPQQLNALSDELMDAVGGALRELDEDAGVRAIVLGGGERAFAAGADIAQLARMSAIDVYVAKRVGGCELALACDVIVAAESARFGQPETGVGIIPGAGGTQLLTRAVGKAVAMDVILSGRTLHAREALSLGLVARVVAQEAWLEEAKRVAHDIASKAPIATRLAKDAVDHGYEAPLSLGLDYERRALALAFATEDATEGLTAFVEKRKPDFKGS